MTPPTPETGHRQTRYVPPAGATEFILARHGASEPYIPGDGFVSTWGFTMPRLACNMAQ